MGASSGVCAAADRSPARSPGRRRRPRITAAKVSPPSPPHRPKATGRHHPSDPDVRRTFHERGRAEIFGTHQQEHQRITALVQSTDQPLPRELKVIDSASLFRLEQRARHLDLSQRLDPTWVRDDARPDGAHYLWPALGHSLSHRPDVPRQLRCEVLIALRAGDHVMSLLDVLPDDFDSLPRVSSREGVQVRRLFDRAPSVRNWLLREGGRTEALWHRR